MILLPSLHKNLFLRQRWVQYLLTFAIIANAILWVLVYRSVEPTVEPVPLHVTVYFGIDFTAAYWWYYFFPLGGLAVIVLHTAIARAIYRGEAALAQVAMTAAAFLNASLICIVAFLIRYLP